MNNVCKVIRNGDVICFIIHTKGETDYWCWEVCFGNWEKYWLSKGRNYTVIRMEAISEKMANEFCNAIENSHYGCSFGSFETVDEAIAEYLKED